MLDCWSLYLVEPLDRSLAFFPWTMFEATTWYRRAWASRTRQSSRAIRGLPQEVISYCRR